jgi:hypothetical protein
MSGAARKAEAESVGIRVERIAGASGELSGWLAARQDASVFQDPAWHEVIRRAYGHETRTWVARRGDEIAGCFAATLMRAPILGTKCIALPYQMHSGAPLGSSPDVCSQLVRACIEDARVEGAKYVEIRHFEPLAYLEELGFAAVDSGLRVTTVPIDDLQLTQAAHGHRQRVRKAGRKGVEIEESRSDEDWQLFRRMYLETGRAMGAPQAGGPYFDALRETMADRCRLYLARYEGRTVGAFLILGDARGVFARCSAHSTPESFKLNVGQALWWQAMMDASEAGCSEFNCGISWVEDAGLIKWKEGWGGTSRPVHVYVLPIAGSPPAAGGYFEGYSLAKAVWKRLPLPVVGPVGHAVTRWIG